MQDAQHRPTILVSAGSADSNSITAMMAMVRATGAQPMLITNHAQRMSDKNDAMFAAQVEADLAKADGVIVMGNNSDIDPLDYNSPFKDPHTKSEADTPEGHARAKYEYALLAAAVHNKTPVLGVCGGMQRLNVLLGGTLDQHVPDKVGNNHHAQQDEHIPPYIPVEFVQIGEGSTLSKIADGIPGVYAPTSQPLPPGITMENSMHHQAVDKIGTGLRVSAASIEPERSDVRIVEAIEADPNGKFKDQFLMGVQWHPEFGASDLSPKLLKHFTNKAREYGKAHVRAENPGIGLQETMRNVNVPATWTDRIHAQRAALTGMGLGRQ